MSLPLLPLFGVTMALRVFTLPPFEVTNAYATGPSETLLVEWDVAKQWGPSPDTASITIYNLDLPTRKILAQFAALPVNLLVQLSLGWGGQVEVAFSGAAWRVEPEVIGRTDTLTVLELGSGIIEQRDTPPSGGADFGVAINIVVATLLQSLGWTPLATALAVVAERAAQLPLKAFQNVYDDDPKEQLTQLMATLGLSWGHSEGFWVVYKDGKRDDILPAVLTPNSGLLSWNELDDGGVQLKALAQPRLVPGAQIQLLNEIGVTIGGGPLRIEAMRLSGSTHSTSLMDITARKLQILG